MATCHWFPELDSLDNHSILQETDLGQQLVLEFLLELAGVEETVPVIYSINKRSLKTNYNWETASSVSLTECFFLAVVVAFCRGQVRDSRNAWQGGRCVTSLEKRQRSMDQSKYVSKDLRVMTLSSTNIP